MTFATFCVYQRARVLGLLDALERRVIQRRWKVDAESERWLWYLTLAPGDVDVQVAFTLTVIDPHGVRHRKRVGPAAPLGRSAPRMTAYRGGIEDLECTDA